MSEHYRKLADKFFNNQCSSEEAERVLEWLDTSDGQKYLGDRLDDDLTSFDESEDADDNEGELPSHLKKLNPESHFGGILSTIEKIERTAPVQRKRELFNPLLKIAATILVIATASVFVYVSGPFSNQQNEQVTETVLSTTADQQREVILGDGTVVHLNQQSAVTLSNGYMKENREVYLEGEAYFEVKHNAALPFIIRTAYSEVEVLGTSFNVKSNPEVGRTEVAVLEGRVAFRENREGENEEVILHKGEYAFLDAGSREITTENFGVENYLAWKNGEFVFDELSMEQVCLQLARFYGVTCKFEDESIKDRRLTANFPNDDLENTLSVIAFSLHLNYEIDDRRILWLNAGEE